MAITRVGTASAGSATAVTVPAHAIGDMIVVLAFRDSATSGAPALPAGFTQILATASTTTGSALLCFKIATSTSDTATGFTNATGLLCMVYRSSVGGILAVGASASGSGTANTGVAIPAVTMQATDGTSAILATMGHRSVDQGLGAKTVTGLTEFLDLTDAVDELTAWDHVGNTSFSSSALTLSGTAGGWVAYTVEILDAGGQWNTKAFSGGNGTFSNSNRTSVNAGGAVLESRLFHTTGKFYFEATASSVTYDTINFTVTNAGNTSWVSNNDTGQIELSVGDTVVRAGSIVQTGDVMACAVDLTNGLIWFKNLSRVNDSAFCTTIIFGGTATFSNTNHTATSTVGSTIVQVHSSVTRGKRYFEIKFPTIGASGVNFNLGDAANANWIFLGNDGSMGSMQGGTFTSLTTINGYTANQVVEVAVDYDAQKVWFRTPAGANLWNNSGTANPATGVGGITFVNQGCNTINVFMADASSVVTINLGDSTFTGTVPSGFNNWNYDFGGWLNDDIAFQNPATGTGGVTLPTGMTSGCCVGYFASLAEGWTLNTGTAAFTGTVPSGFSAWYTGVSAVALLANLAIKSLASVGFNGIGVLRGTGNVSSRMNVLMLNTFPLAATAIAMTMAKAAGTQKGILSALSKSAMVSRGAPSSILTFVATKITATLQSAVTPRAGFKAATRMATTAMGVIGSPPLALIARGMITSLARATVKPTLALQVTTRASLVAKGITAGNAVALAARASVALLTRLGGSPGTALRGNTQATLQTKGFPSSLGLALQAKTAVSSKVSGLFGGVAFLGGRTAVKVSSSLNKIGGVLLTAGAFVMSAVRGSGSAKTALQSNTELQAKTIAAPTAKTALGATSSFRSTGRFPALSNVFQLVASGFASSAARGTIATRAVLGAVVTVQSKARGQLGGVVAITARAKAAMFGFMASSAGPSFLLSATSRIMLKISGQARGVGPSKRKATVPPKDKTVTPSSGT